MRHTHARDEHSPKHLDSGLGRRKAAGREEPRDPRALESLVVVSGVGECDRVPIGKASGAHTQITVPKKEEPTQHNTEHASAHTHVLVTRAPTGVSLTHSGAPVSRSAAHRHDSAP